MAAGAPKFLLTIEKGPHTPFFGRGGEVIVKVMRDFFDHYLKGRERKPRRRMPKDGNVAGTTTAATRAIGRVAGRSRYGRRG